MHRISGEAGRAPHGPRRRDHRPDRARRGRAGAL